MPFTAEVTAELNLLCRFDPDTLQQGLKIHSSAEPAVIAAAQRLFDKGLITLADGGYLTETGRTAAQHAQDLLTLLD